MFSISTLTLFNFSIFLLSEFSTFVCFSGVPLFPPPSPLLLLPHLRRRRSLLRVHALVSAQVSQGAAGVAALGAAVGFLPRVGASVALQVDQLGGGVGADGAAVRLLAVMGPHVAFEVVGVA